MQYEMVQFSRSTLLRDSSDMLPSIKQLEAFALLPLLAFSMMPQLKHEAPTISKLDSSDNLMPRRQGKQRFSAKEAFAKKYKRKTPVAHFLNVKFRRIAAPFFFKNTPVSRDYIVVLLGQE